MSTLHLTDWLAILGGLTAIATIHWYFFFAERSAAIAVRMVGGGGSAPQEARVTVRGGYSPAVVRVQAGRPVRLTFDRQETSGCSEEIVFGDFGVRRFLPAHQTTIVEVTPTAPGTYEFTCGMAMLRGKLVAE